MKKKMAWMFLVAMMLNSYSTLLYATITPSTEVNIYQNVADATKIETVAPENTLKSVPTVERKGNLEVDIKFELPIRSIQQDSNMKLLIEDEEKNQAVILFANVANQEEQKIKIGEQEVIAKIRRLTSKGLAIDVEQDSTTGYFSITLYGLKVGKYALQVSANQYISATVEDIVLDQYSKRVEISNTNSSFLCGDVNGDGKINEEDMNGVLNHIHTNIADKIKQYDLNLDHQVDLVDVSYLVENLNKEAKSAVIVDTDAIIDVSKVAATVNGEQIDVADIFENTKEVIALKPENKELAISKQNPIVLNMNFDTVLKAEQIRIEPNTLSEDNMPTALELLVEDENGKIVTLQYALQESSTFALFTDKADANTIVIDLGSQIAVKKVTIKIIGTKNNTNLAEIAKVELLNNVFEEVPKPKFDIPLNLKATPGSESFKVSFSHAPNVTGYKILVEQKEGEKVLASQTFETTYSSIEIKKLSEKDILNYTTYTVRVESINGEWESGYSEPVTVTPIPNRKAPAPDMITVTEKYKRLDLSWKKMKDTLSYNVYYRIKNSQDTFKVIRNITSSGTFLQDLEEATVYEIYITGTNHLGEGSKSNTVIGKTLSVVAPDMYQYKLINTPNGVNEPTSHILGVEYPRASTTSDFDEFDIVDNDYESYWNFNGWNAGGWGGTAKNSPIVTLDNFYQMNTIIFVAGEEEPSELTYKALRYWNKEGKIVDLVDQDFASYSKKTSNNGKQYYEMILKEPIETNKIQLNLALYWPGAPNARVRIREMKFYYYDSIKDDVNQLFADDLHIELKDTVTLEQIEALETRINTKDEVSGEYHPYRNVILADIELAKKLIKDEAISDVISVDTTISNQKNSHLGFAMTLNDFQPLGVVARAGEQIAVYVGTKGQVMPELIFTQYDAEAAQWQMSFSALKKGQNIITVPKIGSRDTERGGSVYIKYPKGDNSTIDIKVRISGGQSIPVLDLSDKNTKGLDEAGKKELVKNYIIALQNHIKVTMPAYYSNREKVDENGNKLANVYDYDEQTSPLNATELVTNNVLLSVPATKTLQGASKADTNIDVITERLYESLNTFEAMMHLFYKEKGLCATADLNADGVITEEEKAEYPKHQLPGSRINIRYMQMFDGAFMYAGGYHIGIGIGSVAGLMNGSRENAQYFGWGIAHEIGHQIDEADMIFGETSNNIFSLFAQTANDKNTSRLENGKYASIYEKVTSGTKGISSDVFTTLGMFWQLHLAYDDEATLTSIDTFYARLNRLYRTNTITDADRNNLLVRLASDAAGKDLSDFFIAWGFELTDATRTYLEKFITKDGQALKETKKIQYLNDEARRYRMQGNTGFKDTATLQASLRIPNNSKDVTIHFSVPGEEENILGYEIYRNGKVIAFVEGNQTSYIDHLNALNNRVVSYEIVAYDKLLQTIPGVTLEPVKIAVDGSLDSKSYGFKALSNVRNQEDKSDNEDPEGFSSTSSVKNMIDSDMTTVFEGNTKVSSKDKTDAYIVLDLNETIPVCGIRYIAGIKDEKLLKGTIQKYKIEVSEDNQKWITVKTGNMDQITAINHEQLIYFDKEGVTGGNQLWTYNIAYVKITAVGSKEISGAEITLITPPGDDISLAKENIGILETQYQYGLGEDDLIPAGSVVFKGDYRGNPAFNAFLLIDGKEETIEGTSVLFAQIPDNSPVDEIASGSWLFYMTPEEYQRLLEKQENNTVKVQLYRVDDALNSTGQRLVSDTLKIQFPDLDKLPKIEIKQDK